MRPMLRATHGYLMTAAGISPTYVDQPCAITRTGRDRRLQPDINFRRRFASSRTSPTCPTPYRSCTILLSPRFATAFSPSRSSLPSCNAHSCGDAVPRGSVQHVFSPPARDQNPALNPAASCRAAGLKTLCVIPATGLFRQLRGAGCISWRIAGSWVPDWLNNESVFRKAERHRWAVSERTVTKG